MANTLRVKKKQSVEGGGVGGRVIEPLDRIESDQPRSEIN